MAEPTHLSVDVLHRLMRLFMEHKTDVLPVVERGRIVGQVDRLAIMEALSEIRPEGYTLTMHDAEPADNLLRRLDQDGLSGLATINRNFEFNAVWGRAEILQAQGKMPQVRIWQPGATEGTGLAEPRMAASKPGATEGTGFAEPRRAVGEPGTTEGTGFAEPRKSPAGTGGSAAAESLVAQQAIAQKPVVQPAAREVALSAVPQSVDSVVKPAAERTAAATISIVRELAPERSQTSASAQTAQTAASGGTREAAQPVSQRAIAENLHREIENGRMAINTLAALDIPLLACHGSGTEIFHNRAFQDIRLRDAIHLKTEDLVARAKDAIAESALKGELDIDKAVRLKQAPRGYECYCKAIRDYENPASRAFGYIFWLTPVAAPGMPAGTALYSAAEGSAEFTGKTLPEILAAEEARAMAWAMAEANGNQSDAALLLGIPRQTFNYRYRKLTRARVTGNREIKEAARRKKGAAAEGSNTKEDTGKP